MEEWASAVLWEENTEEDSCKLRLLRSPEDMQRLLSALAVVLEARHCVQGATDRFVQRLLLPFARGERSLTFAAEEPIGVALTSRLAAIQSSQPPFELFWQLLKVLRAVNDPFLSLKLGDDGGRVVDFVRCAGADALTTALIDNCIVRSLPASPEKLQSFVDELRPRCKAMERQLIGWGVLDPDAKRLTAYVLEIDSQFLEKKKESLLVRGRDLMRQQLFDIVEVSEFLKSGSERSWAVCLQTSQCPERIN